MKQSYKFALILTVGITTGALCASADTVGTYGDTTVVIGPNSQPAWQLTSDPTGTGYAGAYVGFDTPLAPSALTQLSANYVMTEGTFGGGAPRFSLIDSTNNANNEAYIYFGTPLGGGSFADPNIGQTTYANTGNYADLTSPDVRVYSNGFGGYGNGNTGQTWAQFLADPFVSGTTISYITVDLDGGFTPATVQQMDLGSFDVNGVDFAPAAPVPEPSTWVSAALTAGLLGAFAFRRRKALV